MDPGLTLDVKASIAWALGSHRSLRDNQLVVIGTCRDPCRDQNIFQEMLEIRQLPDHQPQTHCPKPACEVDVAGKTPT